MEIIGKYWAGSWAVSTWLVRFGNNINRRLQLYTCSHWIGCIIYVVAMVIVWKIIFSTITVKWLAWLILLTVVIGVAIAISAMDR